MDIVTIIPCRAPLSSGPIVIPAGTVLREGDYSASEWAGIVAELGGQGAVSYPSAAVINDAAAACEALRLRAGAGDNVEQGIMQSAVIDNLS